MTNEYYITKEEDSVNIGLKPPSSSSFVDYMYAFITIWSDDSSFDSPFKNIEDAEIFAEAIVKLLKTAPLLEDD